MAIESLAFGPDDELAFGTLEHVRLWRKRRLDTFVGWRLLGWNAGGVLCG